MVQGHLLQTSVLLAYATGKPDTTGTVFARSILVSAAILSGIVDDTLTLEDLAGVLASAGIGPRERGKSCF